MLWLDWKTAVDIAIATFAGLVAAPEDPGCVLPEEPTPDYAAWLASVQADTAALSALIAGVPTVCALPPPPPNEIHRWDCEALPLADSAGGRHSTSIGSPTIESGKHGNAVCTAGGRLDCGASGWDVPGQFTNTGCVLHPDGALRLGDHTNSRIVKVTKAGVEAESYSVNPGIQGIACKPVGTIWYAVGGSTIYHIQDDGSPIEQWQVPANGIAWDSALNCLWITNGLYLRRLDDLGQVVASYNLGVMLDGVTYDSNSDTLLVSLQNGEVEEIDKSNGSVLNTWLVAADLEHLAYDLSDNTVWVCADQAKHNGINWVLHLSRDFKPLAWPLIDHFTVVAWVKPDATRSGMIVEDICFADTKVALHLRLDGGVLRGYLTSAVQGGAVQANVWALVGATYDGQWLRLYINGVQAAESAQTRIPRPDTRMSIGARPNGTLPFPGLIDSLRIFPDAKSPQWMADLFNEEA